MCAYHVGKSYRSFRSLSSRYKLYCFEIICNNTFHPSIHCSMGSALVGIQYSLTSSLYRRVSWLLGLALVSWAFARVGVHRLCLHLPYLGVFLFSLLHLPLNFICVSSLRLLFFTHRSTLHLLTFRLVSRLGTGSGEWCPMLRSRRWTTT